MDLPGAIKKILDEWYKLVDSLPLDNGAYGVVSVKNWGRIRERVSWLRFQVPRRTVNNAECKKVGYP